VLASPLAQNWNAELERTRGVNVLMAYPRAPRMMTNSKRAIRTPDDLRGLKLRVPEIPILFNAFKKYYATSDGQLKIDGLLLKAPVLGDVIRKSAVSRFTRTLGTLISSGVSILDGLEITAKTAGNRVISDAIMASRASIAGGDTISAPLLKSGVFPPMVISMIAVGEQTGGLDEMLSKIADFYDEEVDAAVGGLLALMEPMMIVFLGVVVGGMVVAMYLPIFDMINAVQ
jgi:type IV pilus assembly protein PilC